MLEGKPLLEPLTRRRALAWFAAGALTASAYAAPLPEEPFAALERRRGGRLGVYVFDTGSGRSLGYRADERFLLCSTCKVLTVAAVLARVDMRQCSLDQRIPFSERDLLAYAPVTRAHVREGSLPLGAVCAAAMEVSDNTAENLLFRLTGGPEGVTHFLRAHGDAVTRLDRTEPSLNDPSGILDTTTPRAMAETVRRLTTGNILSAASRGQLVAWMVANQVGQARLRAGLPHTWRVGDRTGTGTTECNDVAMAWPPGRAPLAIAAFYNTSDPSDAGREAVLREVGSVAAAWVAAH